MDRYEKLMVFFRGYFYGTGLMEALGALEIARKYHNGMRKDGETPEFQHQLEIAELLLPYVDHLEKSDQDVVMRTVMYHDLVEDYGLAALGAPDAHVRALSKNHITTEEYYSNLAQDAVAALVKGADRVHNIESMAGVFTLAKIRAYIVETREHVLPMLRQARTNHPKFGYAYAHLAKRIKNHIRTIEAFL